MPKKQYEPGMPGPEVTSEELEKEFGLDSMRRIQQLAREGMPQLKRNSFALLDAFRWYVRHLRQAIVRRENPDSTSPMQGFRERMLRAQTEREEMDLLKTRGQLIPLAAYEQHMTALVIAARTRLLQLPGRLAGLIVSLDNPTDRIQVKRLIDEEIRATLDQLGNPNGNDSHIPGNGGGDTGREPPRPSAMARAASQTDIGVGEGKPNNPGRGEQSAR
jgi:phage terminase Nu1 subunit (DNA packaging protein)